MTEITGILVDVVKNEISVITIEDELEEYYRVLNCDCFDITTRAINGKYYEFVCDDEGLLKENPKVSAFSSKGEPMLVGNLFICNHDGPELTSLTEEDIANIMTCRGIGSSNGKLNVALGGVEY